MIGEAATAIATAQVQGAFQSARAQIATKNSKIDWEDYTYPPLLKLFHYKLDELREPHRPVVKQLFIIHLLQVLHFLFNFFNVIVQVAYGLGVIRIISSPIFFLVIAVISTYQFYAGYQGICRDETLILRYKIASVIMFVIHLIMIIPDVVCFNGFVRLANLFEAGFPFPGVLCIIEIIFILALEGYTVYIVLVIWRWSHPPVNY